MRLLFAALSLMLVAHCPASADELSSMPPEEAVVLKQCPSALIDLKAQEADGARNLEQASATASKTDRELILCIALRRLVIDAEMLASDLTLCQDKGDINDRSFVERAKKAAAAIRSSAEAVESMKSVCAH